MTSRPAKLLRILLACAGAAACTAQSAPAEPTVIEQLSRDTEALYGKVRAGIVRVYVPPPSWALNLMGQDYTVKRWDLQIDTAVRDRLREGSGTEPARRYLEATVQTPATQPTTKPIDARGYRLVARGDGSYDVVAESGDDKAVIDVGPRSVGIAVDALGHVLLPYYIEGGDVGERSLTVATGDGGVVGAKFVGSDRQTGLTVLKVDRATQAVVPMTGRRPNDGALVLFLNLAGEFGRLQVWTGAQQDTGLVFAAGGELCGFVRQGQFLAAARCRPVVEQLIEYGKIKRPVLGVFLREILPADPIRRDTPALGSQPAVAVMKVIPNSAADRAGVRDGDLILSLGDELVGDPPSVAAALTTLRGPTPVKILRGTEIISVSVDLQLKQ